MNDSRATAEKLQKVLEENGFVLEEKRPTLRAMVSKCQKLPRTSAVLKSFVIDNILPLDSLLFIMNTLLKMGETIPPKKFLEIFKKSLSCWLEVQGKSELQYHNNDVLIGEIVSVFTSISLATGTSETNVKKLLGEFKWYQDYLDPLGII
ncbi:MAG: hypothetical protein GF308_21665 [Candidatus Heimdallarchaeota archaeon]|nr:hypothetical protein [Candidatus Heimdallarchaeota archaeon]